MISSTEIRSRNASQPRSLDAAPVRSAVVNRRLARITIVLVTVTCLLSTSVVVQAANDNRGRDWRQLIETTGLTWTQVATVCPRDGVTPCTGSVGGRDLTGWVWATREQVLDLFGIYVPDILTSPTGSVGGGFTYFVAAESFFGFLRPTWQVFLTYSTARFAGGWTATSDGAGQPFVGSVSDGTTPVSVNGAFSVVTTNNPDAVDSMRGVFLWRPTGQGGVIANPDAGQITSLGGGVAIANVLANDWVNGVSATIANAQLSLVSSSAASVSLDIADGSVDVAAGTASGTYSLVYRICDRANATICAQATATVTIPAYAITANDDNGTATPSTGGVAVANVLVNDTLAGLPATLAKVQISQLSSTQTGISLDAATGRVNVAAGTPTGPQTLTYQICESAKPTNCDSANVTVTVQNYVIDAVSDYVRTSHKTPGILLANVLANDKFAGGPANLTNVRLSQISLTPNTPYIKLNVTTGAVELTKKVNSVTYSLVYQICEINAPTNCDQATVTLELSGRGG